MMAIREAQAGPYKGHLIRKARKAYQCEEAYGWGESRFDCNNPIAPGDLYVEGDVDIDRAGGFGHYRICIACAGLDASAVPEAERAGAK